MDHKEAVQQMAAERYLLDEMTPDVREAFEAHLFDCAECTLDLRAGATFVAEAKAQLPGLTASVPARSRQPKAKRQWWLGWMQPAFAAPAFATLLLVLGYQNFVTYPALRQTASQPRLLPWAPLHGDTRGAALALTADRAHGLALPVELPAQPSIGAYASYSIDLYDPAGKLLWTGSAPAAANDSGESQRLSLVIPGAMLRNGGYTVAVSGIAAHGERSEIDKYVFDLRMTD
ncbi:MAG: zf-HC2 domain-containing protein [Terracidiphilus sp.]|jgi:hypothetical protein